MRLGGVMLTGAVLLAAGPVQGQGDPLVGQVKAETCLGCHGVPGYRNAYPAYRVPKLGGQHAEYLVSALQAYRQGERWHPTMRAMAAGLTEQDMHDIAAYFAQAQ